MRFLSESRITFLFVILVFLFFVFPLFSFAFTDGESQDGYSIWDAFSPLSNTARVIKKSFVSLPDSVYSTFPGPIYSTFNDGFNNSRNALPLVSVSRFFARIGDGLDRVGDTYDLVLNGVISVPIDAYIKVAYLDGDRVAFRLNPPNSMGIADFNPIKFLSYKFNNKNLISDVSESLGSILRLVPVSSKPILSSASVISFRENQLALSLDFLKNFFGFSDSPEPSLSPSLEPKPASTAAPVRVPAVTPASSVQSKTVSPSAPASSTSFLDSSFIRNLVRQFFNEEKSALAPLNLISVQGSVDDLNQKLAELTSRVNQIPPPLQYSGGGGGGTTTSFGSNNSEVTGSKLTVGNTTVTSGSIGTTSGNFSIDSSGGTTTVSDNLTVAGLLSASTASSHSFTGDLSISDDIEIAGDASASAIFGAGLNTMTGTTGCTGATADKLLYNATTGKFSCGSDQNSGGSGAQLGVEIIVSGGTYGSHYGSVSFDAGMFDLTQTASESYIKLDWTNGPASRSANETVTGKWLYSAASVQFNTTTFELAGAASISVANTNFNINLNSTGDFVVQDAGTAIFTINESDTISLNNAAGDLVDITGRASVSSNLELTGTGWASASYFYAQPGTALLPAFTFGNDTNSGFYRSAADTLGISTNGTERFRLNTTGASFSYNLEINAANARAFVITDLGGVQEDILVVDTTASVSNSGIDITAGEAQTGNLLNFYNSSDALLTHFSATGGLVINIASISAFNIQNGSGTSMFRTDSNTGRTSIGNTALKNFLFVVDPNTGSAASGSFGIRSSNTTGNVASISATTLTTGNVFSIVVPPSSSFTGDILLVKDTNNRVLASLGYGGRPFLTRGTFSSYRPLSLVR